MNRSLFANQATVEAAWFAEVSQKGVTSSSYDTGKIQSIKLPFRSGSVSILIPAFRGNAPETRRNAHSLKRTWGRKTPTFTFDFGVQFDIMGAMDLSGLDVSKLKSLVIDKWKSDPILWPVKAMPVSRLLDLERQQGGHPIGEVGGFFTCLKNVMSKTPAEMEEVLGLGNGYFKSGVSIWKFSQLPTPEQFELKGYTQCPDGENFDGMVLRENGAPRPKYFTKDGKPVTFIPGLGVEQCTVKEGLLLPAFELERLAAPDQRFKKWK